MNHKPRILIIENSIGVTGALKSIVQSVSCFRENFEIFFVVPQSLTTKLFILNHGFNHIYELPMKELRKNFGSVILYFPYLILNAFRLRRLIKEHSISLIHANDIYNLLPVMNRLLGNNTPYVCHIRFMPDKFPGLLMQFWFALHHRFSQAIIAVSKSVKSQLPDSSKVIMIYDALPTTQCSAEQMGERENFIFLYLSNFMDGKGHNFALEAFSKIGQKLPDWKLRFVGGDLGLAKNTMYKETLKARAKQLGIYTKTEWIEFTNDVEREYRRADIVLNFSESESFSMTCLEALFFGRPLIASDCGGPAELLEGGQIGILVPNRDIDAMAKAMEELANNAMERNRMGEKASLLVRQKFNADHTSHQLKALYQKIISA